MSLFRKLNSILIIQSIFGLFPFKVNPDNDKVELCFCRWVYSVIVHGMLSTAYLFILINYALQDGFHDLFDNTQLTSRFLQIVNLELSYFASIVGILLNTRKYAKFLNNLNYVERKVEKFRKSTDKLERNLSYVYVFIIVLHSALYFVLKLNLNSAVQLMYSICFGLKILAITLIAIFITSISAILNNRMDVIISTLDEMSANNFKKNITKINECILIFDELWCCKGSLSKLFGLNLFFLFCYDFIGISIFLYLLASDASHIWSSNQANHLVWLILLNILVNVVPYVIREILVVHEMDKLGKKVISHLTIIIMFDHN